MIKNTFDDTIFYSSVPRTIFPAAKFYSIARKIITRKVVPGTTYSNTPLIKTPIPACCKISVRALKPTIVQRIDTCGSIANYNYKMPLVNGWVIRKSRIIWGYLLNIKYYIPLHSPLLQPSVLGHLSFDPQWQEFEEQVSESPIQSSSL